MVAVLALGLAAFLAGTRFRFEQGSTSASGERTPARVEIPEPGRNGPSSGATPGATGKFDAEAIVNDVDDEVVNITTSVAGGGAAAGTGIVLTNDGDVLTNFHVIDGATSIAVEVGVSGATYRANVVGYDQSADLALLHLVRASGLHTVRLGDSSSVSVDEPVVAIGNAEGRGGPPVAVVGTVTDLDRTITAGDGAGSETLSGMIEISAAIQPGDSGGPVVDAHGDVIGVTTAAEIGGGRFGRTATTRGYAIPIDTAEKVVSAIRSGSNAGGVHLGPRGYLGVEVSESPSGGALVEGVQPGSGADAAGIEPGSVISGVDGTRIGSPDSLRTALDHFSAGDRVQITWVDPGGDVHHSTVRLTDLS